MNKWMGLLLLLAGMAGAATAGLQAQVPEVDPASAGGALSLLIGGLLVIRSRKAKR